MPNDVSPSMITKQDIKCHEGFVTIAALNSRREFLHLLLIIEHKNILLGTHRHDDRDQVMVVLACQLHRG